MQSNIYDDRELTNLNAEELSLLLNNPDRQTRIKNIQLLGNLKTQENVYALLSLLSEQDPQIVWKAVQQLGLSQDQRVIEPLLDLYSKNNYRSVRSSIIAALGNFNNPKVVQFLVDCLDTNDSQLCDYIAEALKRINGSAAKVILATLKDARGNTKANLIFTLQVLQAKEAVPFLIEDLTNPDPEIRGAEVRALGILGDKQILPSLSPLVEDTAIFAGEQIGNIAKKAIALIGIE